ncbi:hypothetical protein BJF79_24365 [Actinomadura sp. CNU-125]|nr:hypothetical protein BJF79_24365 [Actinomadura sp. CNU-125]
MNTRPSGGTSGTRSPSRNPGPYREPRPPTATNTMSTGVAAVTTTSASRSAASPPSCSVATRIAGCWSSAAIPALTSAGPRP